MSVAEIIPGPQTLLRGRVTDRLTGADLRGATLRAELRQGGDWRPFPFVLMQREGGWFAAVARSTEIAARVRVGVATDLRLSAAVPGYTAASHARALAAAEFSAVAGSRQIGGVSVATRSIAGAPFVLDLALSPDPVMLAGLVLMDHDPASPVAGATVTITGPGGSSVVTDAMGRFRFETPPLARSWAIGVALGPATASATHVTDFAKPVNFAALSLVTANP